MAGRCGRLPARCDWPVGPLTPLRREVDMIRCRRRMKTDRNAWVRRCAAQSAAEWCTRLASYAVCGLSRPERYSWRRCDAPMRIAPPAERLTRPLLLWRRKRIFPIEWRGPFARRRIAEWTRRATSLKVKTSSSPAARCAQSRASLTKHVKASPLNPATDQLDRVRLPFFNRLFQFLLLLL